MVKISFLSQSLYPQREREIAPIPIGYEAEGALALVWTVLKRDLYLSV
jgi:hypothetical protein